MIYSAFMQKTKERNCWNPVCKKRMIDSFYTIQVQIIKM